MRRSSRPIRWRTPPGGQARIVTLNQVPLTDEDGDPSSITRTRPLPLPANIEVSIVAGILGVSSGVTVRSNGVVVQSGLLSGLVNLVGSLTGLQLNLGTGVVILQTYTLRIL